ncbi:MAG: Enoyl-(acyl-carrier-protein) reductase [Frankiales bacterium]|nr:Enoyl-(acyl-carrier-protein) reductase [Frankiales bacterium]
MGLLDGKRLLITGVITDASIAFSVAKIAQEQGAEVVLTGFGRMSLVERVAKRLPVLAPVVELDVTSAENLESLASRVREQVGASATIDGVLHSIGFAPASCLGEPFLDAPAADANNAFEVSAFSLKSLAAATLPLFSPQGGSIVGLTFDAAVAWPAYNWMGVAKAALEATSRYLARELGPRNIRVNLIAAGPIRTMAAKSIPGFAAFEDARAPRAPHNWDINDATAVGRSAVALLSDWLPATTGEIVHVDGGFHAIGV